jgi:hypothetical protein
VQLLDSKAENFTILEGFYNEEINSIEVELSELVGAPPP